MLFLKAIQFESESRLARTSALGNWDPLGGEYICSKK